MFTLQIVEYRNDGSQRLIATNKTFTTKEAAQREADFHNMGSDSTVARVMLTEYPTIEVL